MAIINLEYKDVVSDILEQKGRGKEYMFLFTPKNKADMSSGLGGDVVKTLDNLVGVIATAGKYLGMSDTPDKSIFIEGIRYIFIDPQYAEDFRHKVAIDTAEKGKYIVNVRNLQAYGFLEKEEYDTLLVNLDVDKNTLDLTHSPHKDGILRIKINLID